MESPEYERRMNDYSSIRADFGGLSQRKIAGGWKERGCLWGTRHEFQMLILVAALFDNCCTRLFPSEFTLFLGSPQFLHNLIQFCP